MFSRKIYIFPVCAFSLRHIFNYSRTFGNSGPEFPGVTVLIFYDLPEREYFGLEISPEIGPESFKFRF